MKDHLGRYIVGALLVVYSAFLLGCGMSEQSGERRKFGELSHPSGLEEIGTMAALDGWVAECSECISLLYVWSEGMPLSTYGRSEIARAAAAMNVRSASIPAEAILGGANGGPRGRALARELALSGALQHYPSVSVIAGAAPVRKSILGHKNAATYLELLGGAVAALRDSVATGRVARQRERPAGGGGGTVLWERRFTPPPGFFFRHVPNTTLIAYDQGGRVYLEDYLSGRQFRGPGSLDFVPSPDGRLFATPRSGAGLEFFSVTEVLLSGAVDSAWTLSPAFRDPAMDDQYPSIGILSQTADSLVYRVVVSWFNSLAARDYLVARDTAGGLQVSPRGDRFTPCTDFDLSIPIVNDRGTVIAARDETDGTTKLFWIGRQGDRCDVVDELKMQTGKVGFSPSGRAVAWGVHSEQGGGVYLRHDSASAPVFLSGSESDGLTIPEFVDEDAILVSIFQSDEPTSAVIRMLQLPNVSEVNSRDGSN